ncbi:hypothetical protein L6452_30995 [Arctium lappa]|uniref:Uncharacterized protein n=1 Tax=Arctium lappa TaxID=4217 RepID=A0ACB8ZKV9_ARCLA|nr:hypothetical protein L6452_30995 [Arctium lappa]
MAFNTNTNYYDNGSLSKPPRFSRDNFSLWNNRMMLFLERVDPTIPEYIENGPYEPIRIIVVVPATATTEAVPERYVIKEIRQWSDEDKKKVGIDARAKTIISMALPDEVFQSIMHLKTSKEMWETICVQYEGTTEFQGTRKINLVRQYESFIVGKNESLSDVHQRFNCLIIDLRKVGRTYSNSEVLTKFLEFLPESWDSYSICLKLTKDLNSLSLSTLYGILLNYEQSNLLKKNLVKDSKDSKSTPVALVSLEIIPSQRSTLTITELDFESEDQSDPNLSKFDESLALLTNSFKRFSRKSNFRRNKPLCLIDKPKSTPIEKAIATCYNCEKIGHFASECRSKKVFKPSTSRRSSENKYQKLKSYKQKGNGLIAEEHDWAESKESSSDEEEVANLCLMAEIKEEVEEASEPSMSYISSQINRMAQSALVASKNVKFAITDSELLKNNHLARLDFDGVKYPHLVEAAMFLKQSCIAYAITVDPTPSKALLQQFCTKHGPGMMTALGLRKALRFPNKPRNGFDALPTDAELIQFLDAMEYSWEPKPRMTIPNKKLTLVKKALMSSQLNYIFSHFIPCMSGKSGSLDHASKIQVQMAYSMIAGRNFDYATAIFDDLRSKIEKTERDPKNPYVHFICAYLKFLYPATYPTNSDATFPKVGQRSLEVKTLPNEVSISELRSRLSLHTSSSSAVTQEVPSSAIPTTTPSKRPSTGSLGPSKKAKVTKEKGTSSLIPKDVSHQTSLDEFVGLSSTSSAIPTSTVPVTTVAVTSTVTPPIISAPPHPEVITTVTTPIPTSIPISHPSIPLVSDPSSTFSQPQFGPIGPEHQSFEECNQFYKMFDNSGPSLAIVDTNVNSLSAKVESLTASLNNTTSAVRTAVLDQLKAPAPIPAPSFTEKDRTSLNIAVEFIHQSTSDIPVLEGRLTGLEAEVQKAGKKAEQNKEKEADANEKLKETPSHVEGEIAAEKSPPTINELIDEEEDDEDEALDLEVQEEEPHQDDDVDDEEDQSLWCSSAITSSAIASKEVVKEGGSHETSAGTPSQSKGATVEESLKMTSLPEENPSEGKELQIIAAAEADDQIFPISVREIDEEDEEEEESLQHPRRPSGPLHWSEEEMKKRTEMISHLENQQRKIPSQSSDLEFLTEAEIEESVRAEKLIADCERDASLALKIQSSQVKNKKLKKKPVEVQAALLKEIEEECSKEKAVKDNLVDWCKHKINYCSDPMKIIAVTISGRKKKNNVSVTMEITREDGSCKEMFVSKLESLDYMEWMEFKDALKKSKSIYRGYVEGINDALINRVAAILKGSSALPSKPKQIRRKPVSYSSENVAVIRNETSIKFSREALFDPPPDISVLDLSLPPGGPYVVGQVLEESFGIFFRDDEEQLRFQRVSEIPICPLGLLKDLMYLWCDLSPAAKQIKVIISKESLEGKKKEKIYLST